MAIRSSLGFYMEEYDRDFIDKSHSIFFLYLAADNHGPEALNQVVEPLDF